MRLLLILFLFFSCINCKSQVLKDEYSSKRDITLFQFNCSSDSISLKRILTPSEDGKRYSIRKGRELLVAFDKLGKIKYEFSDIGGYSTLFLEKESFILNDINKDGNKELIIECRPFESSKSIWFYSIDTSCQIHFIDEKIIEEYSIEGDEIRISMNLLDEILEGDTDTRYAIILKDIDMSKFTKVDYYKLINSELIRTNNLHANEINERIKDFKTIIKQLNSVKETTHNDWDKENIAELIDFINLTIKNYKIN